MRPTALESMNSRISPVLVLILAVLVAGVVFSVLQVISLNDRIQKLENSVATREEPILSDSQSYVQPNSTKPSTAPQNGTKHQVSRVVDGDTVVLDTDDGGVKTRIIGIDTPETVHPSKPVEYWGPEASARAKELLEGKTVTIHYDPDPAHDTWDKYRRLLVYLELPDGRDFGLVMIQEGQAKAYLNYPFSRQDEYHKAMLEAQENGFGMWKKYPEPIKNPLLSSNQMEASGEFCQWQQTGIALETEITLMSQPRGPEGVRCDESVKRFYDAIERAGTDALGLDNQ